MGFASLFFRAGVLALVVVFFIAGAAPVYAQQEKAAVFEDYILGAGDVLDVRVYGEDEVSRSVFVRIDGRISLPLAGEIKAAGITPEELSEKIAERLSRFFENPNVTVVLAESGSKAYYILGQIEDPGEYTMTRPLTVLQAIGRAGGFLEWAKKDSIMVVSGSGKSEEINYFNYDRFLGGKAEGENILIKPGDTIVIP